MQAVICKLKYIKENYFTEAIILLIIGIILLVTLFINPIVGKCDNGDFARFYLYGGLRDLSANYSDIYDRTVHIKYALANLGVFLPFGPNWVSGTLLLKFAEIISLLTGGLINSLFDIRYLAFVYSILFLAGIFLIVNNKSFSTVLKVVCGAYIILLFTDASYIDFFNSFFGEAGTIVFFFLFIGTFLLLIQKDLPETKHFACFFIASAGFLTSKSQQLPLLPFMLFIYATLYIYYRSRKIRRCIITFSLAVVVLCGITYFSIDKYTNYNNIYQSVFLGVLSGSKTPEKDLQELGSDSKFAVLRDKSFYDRSAIIDPQGEEMQNGFYSKVSLSEVVVFYLKHLDRLWSKIVTSANYAYGISPLSKANFPKGQFDQGKLANHFRLNLVLKFTEIHHNILGYVLFSSTYLAVLVFYFIRYNERKIRLLMLMLLFILVAGASQLVLPIVCSGQGDFIKHLFLISLTYDTMIGIAILWLVNLVSKAFIRCKKEGDKFGIQI